LNQNYPNPFNAQTRIDFATEGGNTTLEIFDITGARVASLLDNNLSAGSYSIIWDGCDQTGKPVSSGTYFYRLSNGGGNQTMRMTLLK
jgi:flagellar hook assembly protein FlgD